MFAWITFATFSPYWIHFTPSYWCNSSFPAISLDFLRLASSSEALTFLWSSFIASFLAPFSFYLLPVLCLPFHFPPSSPLFNSASGARSVPESYYSELSLSSQLTTTSTSPPAVLLIFTFSFILPPLLLYIWAVYSRTSETLLLIAALSFNVSMPSTTTGSSMLVSLIAKPYPNKSRCVLPPPSFPSFFFPDTLCDFSSTSSIISCFMTTWIPGSTSFMMFSAEFLLFPLLLPRLVFDPFKLRPCVCLVLTFLYPLSLCNGDR